MGLATVERFEAKILGEPMSGCLLWLASCTVDGYGHFWDGEKMVLAHRWAYGHFVGPIPSGLGVLHRCDTPPCVNVAHLFVGTDLDNAADSVAKGRRGSARYASKLTAEDVAAIRARLTGRYGEQTEIARDYGVAPGLIGRILRGERWASP